MNESDDAVLEAIQRTATEHDGGHSRIVTSYVLVVESIDADGDKRLFMETMDDQSIVVSLGLGQAVTAHFSRKVADLWSAG